MQRRHSSEFKSLVNLLEENTPVKNLNRDQRIKAHLKNLVKVRTYRSTGTGTGTSTSTGYILTGDGFFITNDHVLPGEEATVYINKIPFPFQLERTLIRSKPHDLVLAQILLNSNGTPSVVLADQYARIGEKVRTYSFSKDKAFRSHGEIVSYDRSSVVRRIFDYGNTDISNPLLDLFAQTENLQPKVSKNTQHSNCTIYQGWSGGPVINDFTGEIIGITKGIDTFANLFGSSIKYHSFSSVMVVRKMINYFLDGQMK